MAEDKKATISKTLNGNTIYYIARNSSGTVFARELTLEKLEAAIKIYKQPPLVEEEEFAETGEPKKKFLTNKLSEKVQKRKKRQEEAKATPSEEPTDEKEGKQFLENELKTKVREKKEQSKKKSFWDKLK